MKKPNKKQWLVFIVGSFTSLFWLFNDGRGDGTSYSPEKIIYHSEPYLVLAMILFVGIFLYHTLRDK